MKEETNMKKWSNDFPGSKHSPQSRGFELIRRYAEGEKLSPQEMKAMRATMYLLVQYVRPPRTWDDFHWSGPERFLEEIWPKVKDREDVLHAFFADGGKKP